MEMRYPSAGARASSAIASVPPAPVMLDTTSDWPSWRPATAASARTLRSVGPPAAKPRMKRMGLSGNVWACADTETSSSARDSRRDKARITGSSGEH